MMALTSSPQFIFNTPQQVADILECQQLSFSKPDAEAFFHGQNQVHVGQGIPAINVTGGHLQANIDFIVFKDGSENTIQFFNSFHIRHAGRVAVVSLANAQVL